MYATGKFFFTGPIVITATKNVAFFVLELLIFYECTHIEAKEKALLLLTEIQTAQLEQKKTYITPQLQSMKLANFSAFFSVILTFIY